MTGPDGYEIMPRCAVCRKVKQPLGRSAPDEMVAELCGYDCPGYRQPPEPSSYWRPDEEPLPGTPEAETAAAHLGRFLAEESIAVVFGLRAQGHLPTIKRMLGAGASWQEIGAAIHWDPATAERFYRAETDAPEPAP